MAMIHPIFTVLVTRPELVVDHVAGYAQLAQEEASTVGIHIARRAIAWGVVVVALLAFLLFAGVAVMLGSLLDEFSWALVFVPGVALAIGAVAFGYARQALPVKAFNELKAQLDADAQALRAIGAKS